MNTKKGNYKHGSFPKNLGEETKHEKSDFTVQQVMMTEPPFFLQTNTKNDLLEEIKGVSLTPEDVQVLTPSLKTVMESVLNETTKENELLKTLNEQNWEAYNKVTELQREILANNNLSPEERTEYYKNCQEEKDKHLERMEKRENTANDNKRYLWGVVGGVVGGVVFGVILGLSHKKQPSYG